MKRSYIIIKLLTVFLCIYVFCIPLQAQFVITQQLSDRMSGTLPKDQLDEGKFRCVYKFTQQIKESKTGNILFQTDTITLDFGRQFSVYYDWNKDRRDSLNRAKTKDLNITAIHHKTSADFDMVQYQDEIGSYFVNTNKGEDAELFKNRLKNEIITVEVAGLDSYKCIEQLDPQDWQFTTDTLTVLGYLCQKATTTFRGRIYEAWFTPEIPISEGPWKLYGLPGLILKVAVDDDLFSFEAIGLENLNDVYITMDKDSYSNCTREEYAKYRSNKRKKLLARHYFNGKLTVGRTINPFLYNDLELE